MRTLALFASVILLSSSLGIAAPETSLAVSSNDFSNGGTLPPRFTCEGASDSPSLRFAGVPANAKSLLIIMDDPDDPKGTVTHWLVWNIAPTVTEFSADSVPAGLLQGTNDSGKVGYMAPCPTSGQHRYYFRVYALDYAPAIKAGARRPEVDRAIKGHILADAILMGRFGRSNSAPTP